MGYKVPVVSHFEAWRSALALASPALDDTQARQMAANVAFYFYTVAGCDDVFIKNADEFAALRSKVNNALSFRLTEFAEWFHIERSIRDILQNLRGIGTSVNSYTSGIKELVSDLKIYDDKEDEEDHELYCDLYNSGRLWKEFLHPTPLSERDDALRMFVRLYIEKATVKCAQVAGTLLSPYEPPTPDMATGVDYGAR